MPHIPDLSEMSPDRWLSEMQEVREQLLDACVAIWRRCEAPGEAVEAFRKLFDEYAPADEAGPSGPLLAVRVDEEDDAAIVFEHESGEAERRVVVEADGAWRAAGAEGDEAPSYRELAEEILTLVPWWSDGAFAGKVGRPGDFVE